MLFLLICLTVPLAGPDDAVADTYYCAPLSAEERKAKGGP
jgi:hypothetical protein